MTRPAGPTEGLTKAERTALLDASYGLLGRIDGAYQRQTSCADFKHSPATIEALAARGLLIMLEGEFAQPTQRGRMAASRLRARHRAIRQWEIAEGRRESLKGWGERRCKR